MAHLDAHHQTKIEPSYMEQIRLLDILPPPRARLGAYRHTGQESARSQGPRMLGPAPPTPDTPQARALLPSLGRSQGTRAQIPTRSQKSQGDPAPARCLFFTAAP